MTTSAKLADIPRSAFSIDEFCARNGISRGSLYNFWRAGIGPRYIKMRSRRLITVEAERDWHHEREAVTSVKKSPEPRFVRRAG